MQAWDLATAQCQHTLTHHKGKVQAVAWNPAEPSVLLSGGFDKSIALVLLAPTSMQLFGALLYCCNIESVTEIPKAYIPFFDKFVSVYMSGNQQDCHLPSSRTLSRAQHILHLLWAHSGPQDWLLCRSHAPLHKRSCCGFPANMGCTAS